MDAIEEMKRAGRHPYRVCKHCGSNEIYWLRSEVPRCDWEAACGQCGYRMFVGLPRLVVRGPRAD
jgi:hypothetical protein